MEKLAQHPFQLLSESRTGDAVQDKVDGVVGIHAEVAADFHHVLGAVGTLLSRKHIRPACHVNDDRYITQDEHGVKHDHRQSQIPVFLTPIIHTASLRSAGLATGTKFTPDGKFQFMNARVGNGIHRGRRNVNLLISIQEICKGITVSRQRVSTYTELRTSRRSCKGDLFYVLAY